MCEQSWMLSCVDTLMSILIQKVVLFCACIIMNHITTDKNQTISQKHERKIIDPRPITVSHVA